ncbi:MAG: PPOX class F420-dependent oxidoreductase [Nitrososphaeraceae archaeon]|nr:PPOX class F420-dependent oxidoreductase [Nitrososphaeraceae archaeon]MDW0333102.1 PPOX class F420-dependent oxidoreductase [Nitrososphaeraceae archaeon]
MVASLYYYNLQHYKNCFILNTDYTKKNLIILDLNDIVREALTVGHLAHLVTLNKDGSPQVSIVWVGLDGDEIVCAHQNLYQKLKNIQRDARVALSMVTGGKTNGLDNYLVINGRARITEGGASKLLNQLAQMYIAPGTTFAPDGAPQGYITHITVERIHGNGPWSQ